VNSFPEGEVELPAARASRSGRRLPSLQCAAQLLEGPHHHVR
jgi:hypothetical protein